MLGDVKDPFEPAPLKKAKKKKAADEDRRRTSRPTKDEPKPTRRREQARWRHHRRRPCRRSPRTPTPTATVPQYSIKVRFGAVTDSSELTAKTVERLTVLPDEEAPVLVYKGVEDGGKVAVFELTGVVDAQGDGKCEPTPEDCQYLKLRAGETEFITVTETGTEADAQYQLDLVKIYKKDTKVVQGVARVRGRVAGQGRLGAPGCEARPLRLRLQDRHAPAPEVTTNSRREADDRATAGLVPAVAV